METNQNRRKRDRYIKWLSYALVFLFMVAFRYIMDRPDNKGTDSHTYRQEAVVVSDYFMPGNEVCVRLIAELKDCQPDLQVYHLVD